MIDVQPEATRHDKVVLGLGNLLCQDDGTGLHLLRELQRCAHRTLDVAWIDGGVIGMGLLPLVESCSHLLVLDALDVGARPGTVVELDRANLRVYGSHVLSQHQVTFTEVLEMAVLRSTLPPHLSIVGVQPKSMSLGLDLSAEVFRAIPDAVARAIRVLESWTG